MSVSEEEEEGNTKLVQIGAYTFKLVRRPNGTYLSEPLPPPSNKEGVPLPITEGKILGKFESESVPGLFHYVSKKEDKEVYCTCPGFIRHKHCWHFLLIKQIGVEKITTPLIIRKGVTKWVTL